MCEPELVVRFSKQGSRSKLMALQTNWLFDFVRSVDLRVRVLLDFALAENFCRIFFSLQLHFAQF